MLTTFLALTVMHQTIANPANVGPFRSIDLAGDLDVRRPYSTSTLNLSWHATLELKEGRAAGLIFWADDKLTKGYSVRLDARLGQLILSKIGPWPEEQRLATYPWGALDGRKVSFSVKASNGRIRVWKGKDPFAILEATGQGSFGSNLGFQVLDGRASFTDFARVDTSNLDFHTFVPKVGAFKHIYDQSVGEKEGWYVNDHCFFPGPDGWHLYGITHPKPANPMDERNFVHATSPNLLDVRWKKNPFALTWDPKVGENHLWAPHVVQKGDTYYMFYCAGSQESNYHYRINLATSKDLKTWTRHPRNPMFKDFYDARDPMVLLIDGTYYLYYTANLDKENNHHIVSVRTSKNLIDWSPARVVMTHPEKGTFGGPTESPFVVRYGDHFYLFVGPDGDYHATKVYRSSTPLHWEHKPIYTYPSHASEVVQDKDDKWYASDSGWDMNGVYLAPLTWQKTP